MNRAPARTSGASQGASTFHIRLAITLSAVLLGTLPAAPMLADQVDLRGVAAEVELAALAQRQLNRSRSRDTWSSRAASAADSRAAVQAWPARRALAPMKACWAGMPGEEDVSSTSLAGDAADGACHVRGSTRCYSWCSTGGGIQWWGSRGLG